MDRIEHLWSCKLYWLISLHKQERTQPCLMNWHQTRLINSCSTDNNVVEGLVALSDGLRWVTHNCPEAAHSLSLISVSTANEGSKFPKKKYSSITLVKIHSPHVRNFFIFVLASHLYVSPMPNLNSVPFDSTIQLDVRLVKFRFYFKDLNSRNASG